MQFIEKEIELINFNAKETNSKQVESKDQIEKIDKKYN